MYRESITSIMWVWYRIDDYVIVVLRNGIELTFGIVFELFSSLMPEKYNNQNDKN